MKKKVLITLGIILAVILAILIIAKFILPESGNGLSLPFIDSYSKDDNFRGPEADEHLNDRDGVFNSLAISPTNPDIVFVGTENNAFFKSIDGGETWQWIREGFWHDRRSFPEFYDIAINPKNEKMIYTALTNGPQTPNIEKAAGFYRSEDGGENWERLVDGLPNTGANSVAVIPGSPDKLLIGLDGGEPSNHRIKTRPLGGLYASEDEGRTWQAVAIPKKGVSNKYNRIVVRENEVYTSGIQFLKEAPGKPRGLDTENSISLIKSNDDGKSWKKIGPPGTVCYYFDVSQDGKTIYFSDGVENVGYKSADGGETWEKTSLSFSNTVKVSPHDPNLVFFSNGNQLFKSTDGLQTGQQVAQFQVDDIEFSLSDSNTIYTASEGYIIHKSTDGGETFSEVVNLREFIEGQ
jgi:photosystem II stability/assembly factor-like uncharacterized protein